MRNQISVIPKDIQDRESEAWYKLCDYIDHVARWRRREFSPYKALGAELYSQIFTLPRSIAKLKKVKKYGYMEVI